MEQTVARQTHSMVQYGKNLPVNMLNKGAEIRHLLHGYF